MSITCPNCQAELDSEGGGTASQVVCPQCRRAFPPTWEQETYPTRSADEPDRTTDEPEQPRHEATTETLNYVPQQRTFATATEEVDWIVARFENTYRDGGQPDLEEHLEQVEGNRAQLLRELIDIDLYYRIKRGLSVRVEDYFRKYELIARDREAAVELAVNEFRLKQLQGRPIDIQQFVTRLPELEPDLGQALRSSGSRKQRYPIRLNCPLCHRAIAVHDTAGSPMVACPACGESFRIDTDVTQTWAGGQHLPRLGRFQLKKAVGHGAFGSVYRAEDLELNRDVALKIPRSGTFHNEEDEDEFIREARSIAQLNHPHIVQVYDVSRSDGFPYIVAEFVEGITLADQLPSKTYHFREVATLVATIAEALAHAHDKGVVHRDLKPANIMMDLAGHPRIMDFGMARLLPEVTLTREGRIIGTPAYMSPEQARGDSDAADARADIYSLGVILYELLTGERPFRGKSSALLHRVVHEEPPPPRELNPQIPRDLETICLRCLRKAPDRRYPSAKYLADEFNRFLRNEPIHARPVSRLERSWLWCRRNALLATSASIIFVILLVTLSLVSWSWYEEALARAETARLAVANLALYEQEQSARREAEASRAEALRRLRQARQAVDLWLTAFSQALQNIPGVERERERMLLQAAQDYERFAEQQSDDPELELERARTWSRMSDIRRLLGNPAQALHDLNRAEEILSGLGSNTEVVTERANVHTKQALAFEAERDFSTAERMLKEALGLLQEVRKLDPEDRAVMDSLATALTNQASLIMKSGRFSEALPVSRQGVDMFRSLLQHRADDLVVLARLAHSLGVRADLHRQLGETAAARRTFEEAITEIDALVEQHPSDLQNLEIRASLRMRLLPVLRDLALESEERSTSEATLTDLEYLATARPAVPKYELQILSQQINLANLDHLVGHTQEAERRLLESIPRLMQLATDFPGIDVFETLASARSLLGQVLIDRDRAEEASQALTSALDLYTQLAEASRDITHRQAAAVAKSHLAQARLALDQHEASEVSFREALQELETLRQEFPELISTPYYAAHVAWKFGESVHQRDLDARPFFEQSDRLWESALDKNSSLQLAYDFAHYLVFCVEDDHQDAERALGLTADFATRLPPSHRFQAMRAAAAYRLGDDNACLEILRSIQSSDGAQDALSNLIWAMAAARQENRKVAARHLELGIAWRKLHRPGDQRLIRLQREAERVVRATSPGDPSADEHDGRNPEKPTQ